MSKIYFSVNHENNTVGISKEYLDNTLYIIEDLPESMEEHLNTICQRYHIKDNWYRSPVLEHYLLKLPYYQEQLQRV